MRISKDIFKQTALTLVLGAGMFVGTGLLSGAEAFLPAPQNCTFSMYVDDSCMQHFVFGGPSPCPQDDYIAGVDQECLAALVGCPYDAAEDEVNCGGGGGGGGASTGSSQWNPDGGWADME